MFKEILNGNSLQILKSYIADEWIDIIITSPPYNVAHKYENYNDDLEFESYLNSMRAIFKECYRVLKIGGRICVNIPFAVKNKESKQVRFLSVYITQILNEIGFNEFELISWHKGKDIKHFQGNNTAWGSWKSPSCPSFRPLGESVLVFYKGERTHRGDSQNIDISSEEFKEWTKNVWYFDKEKEQGFENILCASNNAKKDLHPAPYPEELIERLLKIYSYKDDIVLDPFNGTGTTTYMASLLNRQFIGIELSSKYCEIAINRLQNKSLPTLKSFPDKMANLVNSDNTLDSLNEVFPYKEAFSPYLIEQLQKRFHCSIQSLYDPFCGVGSSFLNPQIKQCFGFDTSPFAINVAKAKLEKLDSKNLQKAKKIAENFQFSNKSYPYPKWESFSKYANKKQFNIIMDFIESFKGLDSKVYHFVRFLVFCNLEKILNYKKDGNGIKFRESKIKDTQSYLKELTLRAFELKKEFDSKNTKILMLENLSSITNKPKEKIDCILTSPPYANLFDYFEIYKMELWSSGIIQSYEDWKKLKKSALRNNKNANLQKTDSINNILLDETLAILESRNLESSILTMLTNYFFDMQKVLKNSFDILKKNGFCFIVVGNSCYKGVPIKTDEILAQEAQKIGFKCVEIIVARKLKTSSQQMKILDSKSKFYLRESIIVLQKEE
ncbi:MULTISPECIES: DNA methyltransferase [Helicobacter]|uniref:site-specific DNA-methyltransferase (cytosine-N(4)-specific) n=2 Tax=Helicobacter ganmani TaxID=60246 RepID=A0A3D8ICJ6_9HELI|nr:MULTISPECIES: DNA methyltransferase [Helicobacter]RDU62800.1 site-specific DNA-methyltransferase [Helicobacter ganmani]